MALGRKWEMIIYHHFGLNNCWENENLESLNNNHWSSLFPVNYTCTSIKGLITLFHYFLGKLPSLDGILFPTGGT